MAKKQVAKKREVPFVERSVTMKIRRGRGAWFQVVINGKCYVMKQVESHEPMFVQSEELV